ncbi:hypothetical protein NPIL_313561 [Nephila pilipes]|uniref:Uncharacterized protein n=1 Tax=Nephila pilipes TaxID=299642 RepID=A0A8X6QPR2_NEPPI|nr:hypothetical protein NPIL_313561 [Nephila pilipes]
MNREKDMGNEQNINQYYDPDRSNLLQKTRLLEDQNRHSTRSAVPQDVTPGSSYLQLERSSVTGIQFQLCLPSLAVSSFRAFTLCACVFLSPSRAPLPSR